MTEETTSHRGLLLGLVLGVPVMAYGVRGALVDAADTHPAELARWIVGVAVVNDLVLVPVALAVGLVGRRTVPARAWPWVRVGLLATGVLGVVAWPFVRGYGRDPTTPSLLARDYGAGLAAALAVVWGVVGLALVLTHVRSGRARPEEARGADDRRREARLDATAVSPRRPGRRRRRRR